MERETLRIPAIKAVMGNWIYYVSTMTYRQIIEYVKMPNEIEKFKKTSVLADKIQRELTDNVDRIVTYLENQPDRFFNSLVLAIVDGRPTWCSGVFEKDGERFTTIGLLNIEHGTDIYPVDGQHRLEALRRWTSYSNADLSEEVPVIIVAHKSTEQGNEKMRRLFTALNRYAKPVSESDKIILDEDDIVSIATRHLVDETNIFRGKITINKQETMSRSDNTNFTNIISLNKCNDFLLNAYVDDEETIERYKRFRQSKETILEFSRYVDEFWEKFICVNKDIEDFLNGKYKKELRGDNGGNLLFRPRGLCAYVDAVSYIKLNNDPVSFEAIMSRLSSIDFRLEGKLWNDILWNGTMMDPGRVFVRNLLIYLYDPKLLTEKKKNKVLEKYSDCKHISTDEAKEFLRKEGVKNEKT